MDTTPTDHYGANSTWQQFVILAHNLLVNFQIETGAPRKGRTEKRTALWALRRVGTLRFELISRAGRLVRPHGAAVLRLLKSERAQADFLRVGQALSRMV